MQESFDESSAFIWAILFLVFSVIFAVLTAVKFVFRGTGLFTMAKKFKIKRLDPLAYIPVAQSYLYGYLAKLAQNHKGRKSLFRYMPVIKVSAVGLYVLTIQVYLTIFREFKDYNFIYFASVLAVVVIFVIITNSLCFYSLLTFHYNGKTKIILLNIFLSMLIPCYSEFVLLYLGARDFILTEAELKQE